jgi:hypothetical protein
MILLFVAWGNKCKLCSKARDVNTEPRQDELLKELNILEASRWNS